MSKNKHRLNDKHSIDPRKCRVILETPGGQRILRARVHWSKPKKLVETIVRNESGVEVGTVTLPEEMDFDVNDTKAIEVGVSTMYIDRGYGDCLIGEARECGEIRLSGTITIDVGEHVIKTDKATALV